LRRESINSNVLSRKREDVAVDGLYGAVDAKLMSVGLVLLLNRSGDLLRDSKSNKRDMTEP
jgi:hypothetical protein